MTASELLEKLAAERKDALVCVQDDRVSAGYASADYLFRTAIPGVEMKLWVFNEPGYSLSMVWESPEQARDVTAILRTLLGPDVSIAKWPALENETDMDVAEQLLRSVLP